MLRRLIALVALACFCAGQALALTPTERAVILSPGSGPTLNFNFMSGILPSQIAFTRALCTGSVACATYFDSTGTLRTAGLNAPRFDYNPSTLAINGLLMEGAATNVISNNTMVGAVAGTPGTNPTNWAASGANLGTIVKTIVGTGTENGINYIDYQLSGTGGVSDSYQIYTNGAGTVVPATQGQTWTSSSYLKITAGSMANISFIGVGYNELNSSASFLTSHNTAASPTSAGLATQRYNTSAATTNASVTYVSPVINLIFVSLSTVNITLRIGMPQMEQQPFASSVIPTSSSAVTRAADNASVAAGPWLNQTTFSVAGAILYEGGGQQFAGFLGVVGSAPSTDAFFARFFNTNVSNNVIAYPTVAGSNSATYPTIGAMSTSAPLKFAFGGTAGAIYGAYSGGNYSTAVNTVGLSTYTGLQIMGTVDLQPLASGWIKSVRYWPRVLSPSEMIEATQ